MDLVQQYLEQILKQTGGQRGPTVTAHPATKLLRAPTPEESLAGKRRQTGFKLNYPGTDKTYEPTGKQFQRKSPVKEDAGAQLAFAGGAASAAIATALISWAHKKYMDWYGKANQACDKMKGSEGKLCRQNYKVQAAKAEIQALKFARSKCRRATDPKQCVQALNKKVRELMDKYPDIEYTMKSIAKHKQETIKPYKKRN
jgi:hypothetical protein